MRNRVGFIGVGHLAGYLVQGLRSARSDLEFFFADPEPANALRLARQYGAQVLEENQAAAERADIIILAVRPPDAVSALERVAFREDQIVISVAAGVALETLRPHTTPAEVVRSLPISCAAINQSPTLLFPDHAEARALFSLLGEVHVLPNEEVLAPATAMGAFYAWVFALIEEGVAWTADQGVPAGTARKLVAQTVRGAAEMTLTQEHLSLSKILSTLVTPGGISEQGLAILEERRSLAAWTEALDAVGRRMRGEM
jgi:pyrroline-5-carboxylate reductase